MAKAADFLIWFITKSHELAVEQKLTTFNESPPLYHYTLKSFQFDPAVSGHACSHQLSEAKLKACVEFLERLNLRLSYFGSLSIGFACHFDPEIAKRSAYSELMERDSFLWHWHWEVPPRWVRGEKHEDREINFYQLQSRDESLFVSLCLLKNAEGFYFIGLGSKDDQGLAEEKSKFEALSGLYNFMINNTQPIHIDDFNKLEKIIPRHHFELSLSSQYIKMISEWVNMKSNQLIPKEKKIHLHECPWHEKICGHELKMYRATSEDLYPFYFGRPPLVGVPNPLPHPVA